MTKTLVRTAAAALAALATFSTVAAANGIAAKQYAAAERHVDVQHVEVVAKLPVQTVVVVGHRLPA